MLEGKFGKDINEAFFQADEKIATEFCHVPSEELAYLVNVLARKYMQTRALADLMKAVLCAKEATERVPVTPSDLGSWLNNLGNLLAWRYERTGAVDDLQQAVFRGLEALDATPHDHPDRAGRLCNLGNWLGRRFELTGAMDDLESAISQIKEAVELTPRGHPSRASRINSLGNWLARRRQRTGNIEDLEQAVRLIEEAVDITPRNNHNRAAYFTSLGNMLGLKYKQTRNPADIIQAILFLKNAVALTPANSPDRANCLSNLGTIFAWKYEQTLALDDLQCAIVQLQEALEAMPDVHRNRAASLCSLGDLLYCRYDETQTTKDYEDCLSRYKDSWNCGNAPPAVRIRVALKAAGILLKRRELDESSTLLHQAVYLLPSISLCNLQQQDQQHLLREFAGLATLAASASLLRGKGPLQALQLLELGRGVIARLQFGLRTDQTSLKKRYPEIVEKLERCQRLLDSPNPSSSPIMARETCVTVQLSKTSQLHVTAEFEKVVDEVRQLPHFERFLLPTENELKSAASGGPVVVINVSPLRCDALLLEADAIRSIPLLNLHHKDVAQKVELLKAVTVSSQGSLCAKNNMVQILEWLWNTVAGPVLWELGFREPPVGDKWPHVWWIPTGLLSLLPLHAAGYHRSTSFETVADRVVSSYSPSINALLYARKQSISLYRPKDILLVSMEMTPGCSPLGKAKEEITAVEEFSPASALKTKLEEPCKRDVIGALRRCDIFHFAGHGMADPVDPSKSRLLLRDWTGNPFTVKDITDLKLYDSPRFLAFLSGCSTGANPAERLHDESINLMTAFQLTGFRHTVGSLWDVYDKYSVDAAREFYKVLGGGRAIDDKAVAWGLHLAARRIREITQNEESSAHGEGDPFAWASYIHMGPYVTCLNSC
jgi:tetratricopeptide (TPR) repeat protein